MPAGPGVPLLWNIAGICALETCLWQNPAGQYLNNCKFILSLQLLYLFLSVILIYVLKQKYFGFYSIICNFAMKQQVLRVHAGYSSMTGAL